MTPESKVKKSIKKVLDNYSNTGLWYRMPVPSGYGKQMLDFIGFHYGIGFVIEAKAPGKIPTVKQEITLAEVRASHTKIFVIDGTENTDTVEDLDRWLSSIKGSLIVTEGKRPPFAIVGCPVCGDALDYEGQTHSCSA